MNLVTPQTTEVLLSNPEILVGRAQARSDGRRSYSRYKCVTNKVRFL